MSQLMSVPASGVARRLGGPLAPQFSDVTTAFLSGNNLFPGIASRVRGFGYVHGAAPGGLADIMDISLAERGLPIDESGLSAFDIPSASDARNQSILLRRTIVPFHSDELGIGPIQFPIPKANEFIFLASEDTHTWPHGGKIATHGGASTSDILRSLPMPVTDRLHQTGVLNRLPYHLVNPRNCVANVFSVNYWAVVVTMQKMEETAARVRDLPDANERQQVIVEFLAYMERHMNCKHLMDAWVPDGVLTDIDPDAEMRYRTAHGDKSLAATVTKCGRVCTPDYANVVHCQPGVTAQYLVAYREPFEPGKQYTFCLSAEEPESHTHTLTLPVIPGLRSDVPIRIPQYTFVPAECRNPELPDLWVMGGADARSMKMGIYNDFIPYGDLTHSSYGRSQRLRPLRDASTLSKAQIDWYLMPHPVGGL